MGNWNSGRRPAPTALKVLRGNPGKRRLNPGEPQFERATPALDKPPAELAGDAVALAEWARVIPLLRSCGVISAVERTSLMALCQQWSRYLEAHGQVRKLGMVVTNAKGIPTTNPYVAQADKALTQCLRLWVELGLTPSGRARLSALPDVEAPTSKWAGTLT